MLNVTDNAQAMVKGLTEDAGLSGAGGLRLALADDRTQLQVNLVPEPEPNDQVGESGEAKVYVAEDTSPGTGGADPRRAADRGGRRLHAAAERLSPVRDLSVGRRPTRPAAAASPPRRPPRGSRARR